MTCLLVAIYSFHSRLNYKISGNYVIFAIRWDEVSKLLRELFALVVK